MAEDSSSKVIIMLFMMLIFAGGFFYVYKFTRLLKTAGSVCENPDETEKVLGTASYIYDTNKKCIPSNCLTGYTFTSNTCVSDNMNTPDPPKPDAPTPEPPLQNKTSGTPCTPTTAQKDTYGVTYNIDRAGVCRAVTCTKGYELDKISGICKKILKSKYTGEVCTPKKEVVHSLEYQKTQNGTCALFKCDIGYNPSSNLKKCNLNSKDQRLTKPLADCSKNFYINTNEVCFIRDSNTTKDYSDAGIKWAWPADQIECYSKVAYYIVDVYGKSNPDYKLGIRVEGGKKTSVGFNDIWYKFMKDGIVFIVTPYDNKDVLVSTAATIELNPALPTSSGKDLGIDMRPLYEWDYYKNIISLEFKQYGGTGNRFGYTIWDGASDTSEKLINYDRDHVGLNEFKYSVMPKGGTYAIYCEAPVSKNTDWFSMTWDEVVALGATNKWYQHNKCFNGDALPDNIPGVGTFTL